MSQNKPSASEDAKLSAGEKNEATSLKAGARQAAAGHTGAAPRENAEFLRAENEDDDGYDPYSDRRPSPEPLFERDPWD